MAIEQTEADAMVVLTHVPRGLSDPDATYLSFDPLESRRIVLGDDGYSIAYFTKQGVPLLRSRQQDPEFQPPTTLTRRYCKPQAHIPSAQHRAHGWPHADHASGRLASPLSGVPPAAWPLQRMVGRPEAVVSSRSEISLSKSI